MPREPSLIEAKLPEARPAPSKRVIRARLSPLLKQVIEIMAYEGEPLASAADRAGMSRESAIKAMRKPHNKQAFNQLVREIRENAGQAAYLRVNHMGYTAQSETVKLDANKWIAGVDGIAALKRTEGKYQINHTFGGFTFDEPDAIDGTASEVNDPEDQGDD